MEQVNTPKGVMYLIKQCGNFAYCWDDQTGNDEIFLLSEITFYHALWPLHEFKYVKKELVKK